MQTIHKRLFRLTCWLGTLGLVVGILVFRDSKSVFATIEDPDTIQQVGTKFLTLPFPSHADMKIQAGWTEWWSVGHHGTDYIKGTLDDSSTWTTFPVLSASDGKVIDRWNYELGQGVRIETIVNGITYEVGYNHLATVEPNIIRGNCPTRDEVRHGR